MRVLIVGLGSIGRRHLVNLKNLMPSTQVTVYHQHTKPADVSGPNALADATVYSLEDAVTSRPDAAIIASPASKHVETALALAKHRIPSFTEKPLSHALDGSDDLLSECRARQVPLMVGYCLRFHPSLRVFKNALAEGAIGRPLYLRAEAGQYLPDWRPGQVYCKSVSARKELGGGAVLELSHELDYARWLMGEVQEVSASVAKVSDLDIDVEDTAEIVLRFAGGQVGSVHLDMVQRPAKRQCRVVGVSGTIEWDGITGAVKLFRVETATWDTLCPGNTVDPNQMYLDELRHFLDCVAEGKPPAVTGEDGKKALEIALAAKQSSKEKRVVPL